MNSKQELENIIRKAERKRYEYLKAMFLYVPDAIVKQMSYRQFKKDEYMIYAKTPCDTIYVIVSGDVAGVDYQKQGHVYYFLDFVRMPVVGDFEVFGDISEYTVSIYAAQDTGTLLLPAASYLQWIQNDENALFLRIRNIISMLTLEQKSEREYLFMNCRERLIRYFVSSYENQMQDSCDKYRLDKTQLELSDRTGYNIRSVQRGIASLEKEELISIENGKILISKEQFLRMKQYEDE